MIHELLPGLFQLDVEIYFFPVKFTYKNIYSHAVAGAFRKLRPSSVTCTENDHFSQTSDAR